MKNSFVFICCVFFLLLGCIGFYKYESIIHVYIENYKLESVKKQHYDFLHRNEGLIKSLPILKDEPNAWYNTFHVIAHGGGGVQGKCNTNSFEALNLHYDGGTRLFDVDFNWTSDSVLVLRHDWRDNLDQGVEAHIQSNYIRLKNIQQDYYFLSGGGKIFDSQLFSSCLIYGKYHPLKVEDVIDWLETHPDALLMPDLKGDKCKQLRKFIDIAASKEHNLAERIIIRVETIKELTAVKTILPDVQIMYRRYHTGTDSFYDILKFCIDNDIHNVCLAVENGEERILREFESHGVHVWLGVVDYSSDFFYYGKNNVTRVVSNFIYENDIKPKKY